MNIIKRALITIAAGTILTTPLLTQAGNDANYKVTPSNLNATIINQTGASFTWDTMVSSRYGTAESYILYRNTPYSYNYYTVYRGSDRKATDLGLEPGGRYVFKVAPVWSGGSEGGTVDEITLQIPGGDYPGAIRPESPQQFRVSEQPVLRSKNGSPLVNQYLLSFHWNQPTSGQPAGYLICQINCSADKRTPQGTQVDGSVTQYTGGVQEVTKPITFTLFAIGTDGRLSAPTTYTYSPTPQPTPTPVPTIIPGGGKDVQKVSPNATPAPVTTPASTPKAEETTEVEIAVEPEIIVETENPSLFVRAKNFIVNAFNNLLDW